jgi:hypothetical protein
MRFRSKKMMEYEHHFMEEEMLKFASNLIYESDMDRDQVTARFTEAYGEENMHIIEEILDEEFS